jgi:hypothetical protein
MTDKHMNTIPVPAQALAERACAQADTAQQQNNVDIMEINKHYCVKLFPCDAFGTHRNFLWSSSESDDECALHSRFLCTAKEYDGKWCMKNHMEHIWNMRAYFHHFSFLMGYSAALSIAIPYSGEW